MTERLRLHISRLPAGELAPKKPICGAATYIYSYTLGTYYVEKDGCAVGVEWCSDCVGHLTPLDELGNTEL